MFLIRLTFPLDRDQPVPQTMKLNRCAVQGGANAHLNSATITTGVFPREQLRGMERLVNVADKVK